MQIMLLTVYLIFTAIVAAVLLYRFSKNKHIVHGITALCAGGFGFLVEELGIRSSQWSWDSSFFSILNTPISMILTYVVMGVCVSVVTLNLQEHFEIIGKPKSAKWWNGSFWFLIILSGLSLLSFAYYDKQTSLLMFFLFASCAIFFKYPNPIIIMTGAFAAMIEIIADTLMLVFGSYASFSTIIPYKDFFIMGMFFAGFSIMLDDVISKKLFGKNK